jgi:photosystem II stability/assembly factor-like uncharacterized protein
MRTLKISLLVFILSINISAQWHWIYPWPFGSEVVSQSSYQSNVWIIGQNGDILKSTDYGVNWHYEYGENTHNLRDVFFLTSTIGWIGNRYGTILKTVNGGNVWQVYSDVIPYEIIDIFFKDELNGWASTYSGVFRSTDGGITWTLESNLPILPFNSIQFINTTNGYIAGWNGNIFKTSDGGESWINVSTSNNFRIECVYFTSPDTGWISGGISNMYLNQAISKTTDGGNTWIVQFNLVNQSTELIYSVCVSDEIGFASSSEGQIYKTINGGNNWDIVYQSGSNPWTFFSNIAILNTQRVFASGATVEAFRAPRILISTDQGLNWNSIHKEFNLDVISGSYFFNQDEGLMCGYTYSPQFGSFIYKTYDGGYTWLPKFTSNHSIADNFFINNSVGWACGESLLLKTTNSGESWQDFSNSINGYLKSVFFLTENLGWVVGDYNTNFRTTDGGNSWISMSTGYNLEPAKVFFINNQHGWIAGNYGYIRKTVDGGQNWIPVQNMPLIKYNDIFFRDLNNGLLAADDGNIFITVDGGDTWQNVPSGTGFDVDKLFYLDENNIWAVGYNGIILKSTDTGYSWEFNSSPNFRDLTSVFFIDNNYGWAFGENGTIIHTINGGIPVELVSFTAVVNEEDVQLNWITATKLNNSGFEILRFAQNDKNEWNKIGFVPGHGTTTETQHYSFTDNDDKPGKYQYILKQIDYDGTYEYSQIVEVEIPFVNKFSLSQNYPNPFNPVTKIKYQIPLSPTLLKGESEAGGFVILKVYDILGREVATLVNEEKPAGEYEIEFNAANLPSGIYFYQLQAGQFLETKKMILLK